VDFAVRATEIVGIAGLLGSGAEDIPYLCFGSQRSDSGVLTVAGRRMPLPAMKPFDAVRSGVALVPADRRRDGIAPALTVAENATVLVLATHGMTRLGGASDMLPELLEGLGLGVGGRGRMAWAARLPRWAKRFGRRVLSQDLLDRHRLGFYTRISGFHGAAVLSLMNYRTGALRLNLAGREPEGRIQPGEEEESVIRRIVEAVSELRDERTGEPILLRATRVGEALGEERHPDLPDLFLEFRQDLGPIDAARSPRLGRLVRPRLTHRTGDHTPHSRLWIAGPGAPREGAGGGASTCDLLDLAPTVLRLCGVDPPPIMDGSSLA